MGGKRFLEKHLENINARFTGGKQGEMAKNGQNPKSKIRVRRMATWERQASAWRARAQRARFQQIRLWHAAKTSGTAPGSSPRATADRWTGCRPVRRPGSIHAFCRQRQQPPPAQAVSSHRTPLKQPHHAPHSDFPNKKKGRPRASLRPTLTVRATCRALNSSTPYQWCW